MKILFLNNGDLPDYQQDCLLHGLKSIMGDDVVDYRRCWYMYENSFGDGKFNRGDLYGRGFSIFGLLPSDAAVDRTDIVEKIQKKYFDLIIYGSIHRCQSFFGGVTSTYPKNKIAFIDGEDHPHGFVFDNYITFKRELGGNWQTFFPIHFGIPSCKILKDQPEKTRFMSEYDPLVNRTYIYETEADYYHGYAKSYFAPTMKKAGWDCMRHYEILANWCIPYFRSLEGCPETIMHDLPRKELLLVKNLIEYGPAGCDTAIDLYPRIIEPIMKIVREKLTTEAIARYVLDTVSAQSK